MPAQYGPTCRGPRRHGLRSPLRFLRVRSRYLSVALKRVVTSDLPAGTAPLLGKTRYPGGTRRRPQGSRVAAELPSLWSPGEAGRA